MIPAPLWLLLDRPRPGAENMRIDTALLAEVAAGGAGTVRIYGFAPACLSLGRLQRADGVDEERCRRDGVDVVRRPTGGRAVLHDAEVTYAVACSVDDPDLGGDVLTACARVHAAIAAGLALLGVTTRAQGPAPDERVAARERARVADCFARPASHELLDVHGRKLVGSAQARRGRGLLQHGSVLLEPHRGAAYLREAVRDGPQRRSSGVRELLERPVSFDELAAALADGFRGVLGPRLIEAQIGTGVA